MLRNCYLVKLQRSDHDLLIDQLKLGRGVHLVLFEVKVIG